jgi:hypothetical protein
MSKCRWLHHILALLILLAPAITLSEPTPGAVAGFNSYITEVESRLAEQHRLQAGFLAPLNADQQSQLRDGQLVIQRLSPDSDKLPGALLHHWRATVFAPGVTASDFERVIRHFDDYPRLYAPEVLQGKVLSRQSSDHIQAFMRIRQHHVLTVVLDTWYDITYGHLDPKHGYTISRSTKISEISSPGTANERELSPSEDHGFLWRLNTYWTYEEADGGLYMQVESVSLTRSIPAGLAWVISPFIESVPRESLEFTLRSTVNALRK